MNTKPSINWDLHTPDEWREMLGPVPDSWWNKTHYDKIQWLKKKMKQEQRFTHVDIEAERADNVRKRIGIKLLRKRREKDKEELAKYGL